VHLIVNHPSSISRPRQLKSQGPLLGEMNLDDDDHDSWREEMASPV